MSFLKWLFGEQKKKKESNKRIFISFAIEDEQYRNYLVQQAKSTKSPFYFVDMSVKKPWKENEWKKRCRTKIKRCHGVIVLLSKNTYHASGVRFEMKCANEEKKQIIGMQIFKNQKKQGSIPPELKGKDVISWSFQNLENFIKSL